MPLDKKGKFHMNPQHAGMHNAAPVEAKIADPGKQEVAPGENEHPSHVELHGKHPGPFKTVHHHGDGTSHEEEHATLQEAHQAMDEHVGSTGEGEEAGELPTLTEDSDDDEY